MNAGIPGMRKLRVGPPTPRALADLGLLRRDDEFVETLRRRSARTSGDRVSRLFQALLAEVDANPAGRRPVGERC
ncbi:hypothetical protein [Yinghuangia soli]|uniref:Uncharacterized protein n=1 Tax=Yinghuangia soli TaxID=2908204 RepID=A0AA41U1X7_9ACTN|nr:hypothetical protein [Yinghuangia soli]MCF2530085.1 hypothetical protein [Yinghuangia soli]